MSIDLDIPEIVLKLIPIIIVIAKMVISGQDPSTITPEVQAAIALFDAMLAYLEVAT